MSGKMAIGPAAECTAPGLTSIVPVTLEDLYLSTIRFQRIDSVMLTTIIA